MNSLKRVQSAIDYYNIIIELYNLCAGLSSEDDISIMLSNGKLVVSEKYISLYMSTELCGAVQLLYYNATPSMLYKCNSCTKEKIYLTDTVSTLFSGLGVMRGENSTITVSEKRITEATAFAAVLTGAKIENHKTYPIVDVLDLYNRPEEKYFELLLEMDEDMIFPYLVGSLLSNDNFNNLDVYCNENHLYLAELALSQIKRELKKQEI